MLACCIVLFPLVILSSRFTTNSNRKESFDRQKANVFSALEGQVSFSKHLFATFSLASFLMRPSIRGFACLASVKCSISDISHLSFTLIFISRMLPELAWTTFLMKLVRYCLYMWLPLYLFQNVRNPFLCSYIFVFSEFSIHRHLTLYGPLMPHTTSPKSL